MLPACHPSSLALRVFPGCPEGDTVSPLEMGSHLLSGTKASCPLPSLVHPAVAPHAGVTGVQQGTTSPGMPPSSEEGAQHSSPPPPPPGAAVVGGSGGDSPRWAAQR